MDPSPLVLPSSSTTTRFQSGTIHDAVSKNPHEVADVVANLAWTPHDENELVEYLDRCATLATRVITDHLLLRAAAAEARQVQEAMATRAPIEQAKGILMANHSCDAAAAFTMLRVESQNTNTKLYAVARAFIAAHTGQR